MYFQRNLGSEMLQSRILNFEGRVNLFMNDEALQAMLFIMNVIHGRTRQGLRFVVLDMLTKIAVLVDYLKRHEAVEAFLDV